MDSTRIMLNSRSERHANGIGNGSDQLGRNFCEQIMLHIQGVLPHLSGAVTRTMTESEAGNTTSPASTIAVDRIIFVGSASRCGPPAVTSLTSR